MSNLIIGNELPANIAAINCSGISVPRDRIEQRIDEMAKQDCSIWNTMFHPRAHNYILSEGETGSDWNSNIPFPTPPSFKRFAEIFKPRLVSRPSKPAEVSFTTGQIYLKPKQASVKNNEIDNCFECGREDNWRSLCECCPNQIRASIAWHQTFAHELVHFSALHASTASWYKYYKKLSSIGLMLAFVFLGVAICFPHHDISYAFWIFFLLFFAIFLQDIHFNYYNFPRWRGWRTSYAVEEIVAEIGNIFLLHKADLAETWPQNSVEIIAMYLIRVKEDRRGAVLDFAILEAQARVTWLWGQLETQKTD